MKVNSDYQAGLEKLKGEQLQKTPGGARFGILFAHNSCKEQIHGIIKERG